MEIDSNSAIFLEPFVSLFQDKMMHAKPQCTCITKGRMVGAGNYTSQ